MDRHTYVHWRDNAPYDVSDDSVDDPCSSLHSGKTLGKIQNPLSAKMLLSPVQFSMTYDDFSP